MPLYKKVKIPDDVQIGMDILWHIQIMVYKQYVNKGCTKHYRKSAHTSLPRR